MEKGREEGQEEEKEEEGVREKGERGRRTRVPEHQTKERKRAPLVHVHHTLG